MARLMPSIGALSVQARRIRVLLVDDSAATLAALSQLLVHRFPIEIAGQAENGQEALALADQIKPDLCLTDLQMPVMDGFRLVELLRRRHPAIRSIVISVNDGPAFREASRKIGADAFIPKERLPDELAVLLSRLFADGAQPLFQTPETDVQHTPLFQNSPRYGGA